MWGYGMIENQIEKMENQTETGFRLSCSQHFILHLMDIDSLFES